eukprot:CAMPEP_0118701898 /NCGR_PEP_ID=MMETSP0800-20121206/17543_1 /TAXON_ID=210618 ORGANISM="Striatella unipunctata, Strain CCMP2910" /NCGR_SAMPLE_ID=MMETSP0800 /ASSEMBLY_ACC=CAM_ASM_000638 /LENGTH=211 /DNA_ID=CAMNT_0006602943 /DNA_START=78 /DNA_END=713 /DNA_ORIENTATION=-
MKVIQIISLALLASSATAVRRKYDMFYHYIGCNVLAGSRKEYQVFEDCAETTMNALLLQYAPVDEFVFEEKFYCDSTSLDPAQIEACSYKQTCDKDMVCVMTGGHMIPADGARELEESRRLNDNWGCNCADDPPVDDNWGCCEDYDDRRLSGEEDIIDTRSLQSCGTGNDKICDFGTKFVSLMTSCLDTAGIEYDGNLYCVGNTVDIPFSI